MSTYKTPVFRSLAQINFAEVVDCTSLCDKTLFGFSLATNSTSKGSHFVYVYSYINIYTFILLCGINEKSITSKNNIKSRGEFQESTLNLERKFSERTLTYNRALGYHSIASTATPKVRGRR